MLNYFSISTNVDARKLQNEDSPFEWRFSQHQNDKQTTAYYADLMGLKFTLHPYENDLSKSILYVRGYLADFYNHQVSKDKLLQNLNRSQIITAFKMLEDLTGSKCNRMRLSAFSYGISFNLPIEITDWLNSLWRNVSVDFQPIKNNKLQGVEAVLSQYHLKAFSLPKFQQKVNARFEVHVKRASYVNPSKSYDFNVNSLASLVEPNNYQLLQKRLIEHYQKIVKYQPINESKLQRTDLKLYLNCLERDFFANLQKENPNGYKRQKKRFFEIMELHNTSNWHGKTIDAIKAELAVIG